jgi:hypothetical protein
MAHTPVGRVSYPWVNGDVPAESGSRPRKGGCRKSNFASEFRKSLLERLNEATQHFKESHPTLTAMVGRVADSLSNLGI